MSFKSGDRVKYIGNMTAGLVDQFGTVVSETYNDHNIEVRWDRATNDTRGDRTSGVYPSNIRHVILGDFTPPVVNVPFQYQGTVSGTMDSGVQALPENLPRYNGEPLPGINWEKRALQAEWDLNASRQHNVRLKKELDAARAELKTVTGIKDAFKRVSSRRYQRIAELQRSLDAVTQCSLNRYDQIKTLEREIEVLKNQAKDDEDYIALQARRLVKRVEQINDIRKACDVDVGLDP